MAYDYYREFKLSDQSTIMEPESLDDWDKNLLGIVAVGLMYKKVRSTLWSIPCLIKLQCKLNSQPRYVLCDNYIKSKLGICGKGWINLITLKPHI